MPGRSISLALLLVLAACAGKPQRPAYNKAFNPAAVKIGKPYQVGGVWYTPGDDRTYEARGIASWYGPGFHALSTANGERYDQDDVTAAHKTLPMPSWVEVENLDNGRRLVVRINDRGPFVDGRIIDLSRRSAQLLGVDKVGLARVRVRRVYPDKAYPATMPVPPVVVAAPAPAPLTPPPLAQPGRPIFVQVAALGDPGRIAWLTGYLASFGPVATEVAPSGLTRVRLGPYADPAAATAALAQLRTAGYSEARLIPSS
ncbi:rare lipoprotein A [Polymorphobacter fuscus]|uniref:septal ring lytic transglycosylase RlpA family protein n=1 Tax=Sandarakinorhabdus fusca TaxID=1439888 RepID=UPI0016A05D22|nr:septal ring lytic transglycosylase RlpA family protein [Polymorphobacter fuscus]NJC07474.1 rare lipoprotein A [Polymorphobacter fuscus]